MIDRRRCVGTDVVGDPDDAGRTQTLTSGPEPEARTNGASAGRARTKPSGFRPRQTGFAFVLVGGLDEFDAAFDMSHTNEEALG